MTDFFQNGIFTTLHDFKTKKLETIEAELKLFSGYRPIELILPSLYSELEGPALKNIVKKTNIFYKTIFIVFQRWYLI